MGGAIHSTYDVRVRAVRAVLDEHLPVTTVARAYGTDRTTLHRWLCRFEANGDSGLLRKEGNGRPRSNSRRCRSVGGQTGKRRDWRELGLKFMRR